MGLQALGCDRSVSDAIERGILTIMLAKTVMDSLICQALFDVYG